MIGSIRGEIIEAGDDHMIVETGGIGYIIHTTAPTLGTELGTSVHVWTYHVIRENNSDLYGFFDTYSRDIFTLLLTIPKIGPKSAQQILQKASVDLLTSCVRSEDAKRLATHSGLGPKTAEKVVSALRDSLPAADPATTPGQTDTTDAVPSDVIDALVALGYSEREAYDTATYITTTEPELLEHTPQAITRALQLIKKG